eukprot:COSAG04_NODE_19181_length_422_cov_1.281734_1_plen_89_part_01
MMDLPSSPTSTTSSLQGASSSSGAASSAAAARGARSVPTQNAMSHARTAHTCPGKSQKSKTVPEPSTAGISKWQLLVAMILSITLMQPG